MVATQGDGQVLQFFCRTAPARELGQGGLCFFLRAREFTAGFGEPRIEVAGLASLADRPAERFDIARLFQVGPAPFPVA